MVLVTGNLTSLGLFYGRQDVDLSVEANLRKLKRLRVSGLSASNLPNWLVKVLPQVRIQELDISLTHADLNSGVLFLITL